MSFLEDSPFETGKSHLHVALEIYSVLLITYKHAKIHLIKILPRLSN